jgi:hypothetical protein
MSKSTKINVWELRKNQHGAMILQYMRYSKCKSLDELINFPLDKIGEMLDEYMSYIMEINTENVVTNKMYVLQRFFEVNDIKIILKGYLFDIPTIEKVSVLPLSEF